MSRRMLVAAIVVLALGLVAVLIVRPALVERAARTRAAAEKAKATPEATGFRAGPAKDIKDSEKPVVAEATPEASGGAYPGSDQPFIWEEEFDKMLASADGDVLAVYKKLSKDHRMNFIDMLTMREQLREHVRDIVAIEEDSAVREYLLLRTMPLGIGGETDFAGDSDLVSILELPTKTPIQAGEWQVRLALAGTADESYGLDLARQSTSMFPEDPAIGVLSDSMLLNMGKARNDVSADEMRRAEKSLFKWMAPEGGGRQLGAAEQLRGFTALALSGEETDEAAKLIREAIATEDQPELKQALEELLAALGK